MTFFKNFGKATAFIDYQPTEYTQDNQWHWVDCLKRQYSSQFGLDDRWNDSLIGSLNH